MKTNNEKSIIKENGEIKMKTNNEKSIIKENGEIDVEFELYKVDGVIKIFKETPRVILICGLRAQSPEGDEISSYFFEKLRKFEETHKENFTMHGWQEKENTRLAFRYEVSDELIDELIIIAKKWNKIKERKSVVNEKQDKTFDNLLRYSSTIKNRVVVNKKEKNIAFVHGMINQKAKDLIVVKFFTENYEKDKKTNKFVKIWQEKDYVRIVFEEDISESTINELEEVANKWNKKELVGIINDLKSKNVDSELKAFDLHKIDENTAKTDEEWIEENSELLVDFFKNEANFKNLKIHNESFSKLKKLQTELEEKCGILKDALEPEACQDTWDVLNKQYEEQQKHFKLDRQNGFEFEWWTEASTDYTVFGKNDTKISLPLKLVSINIIDSLSKVFPKGFLLNTKTTKNIGRLFEYFEERKNPGQCGFNSESFGTLLTEKEAIRFLQSSEITSDLKTYIYVVCFSRFKDIVPWLDLYIEIPKELYGKLLNIEDFVFVQQKLANYKLTDEFKKLFFDELLKALSKDDLERIVNLMAIFDFKNIESEAANLLCHAALNNRNEIFFYLVENFDFTEETFQSIRDNMKFHYKTKIEDYNERIFEYIKSKTKEKVCSKNNAKETDEESEFVESYFIIEQNNKYLVGEVLVVKDGKPVKGELELNWNDYPMSALKFETKEAVIDFLWKMKDKVQIDSIVDCSKEVNCKTFRKNLVKPFLFSNKKI